MIDQNKNLMPESYAKLVNVLGKIAEKREAENQESEKLFKAIEAEARLMKKYSQSWTKGVVIALVFAFLVPFITLKEKSSSIWEISYFWGIIFPLVITIFMLFEQPGKGMTFSNGTPIKVKGQLWKKAIYYILAWVPWYSCLVLRLGVDPLQGLWMAPVSLVVLIILALTKDKVSAQTDPLGVKKVYAEDYRTVKINQRSGGLNPDAMPPILMTAANKDEIMRMTPQDWNLIGLRLRQAGYKNVLKKGK